MFYLYGFWIVLFVLIILIVFLINTDISWGFNPKLKTKIVLSFKSKNQSPLIMVIKEYWDNGAIVYAKILWQFPFRCI